MVGTGGTTGTIGGTIGTDTTKAPEAVVGGAGRFPVDTDFSQISYHALKLMAQTQAEGNKKYGYGNWQKGLPVSNLLSHAMDHLLKFQNGIPDDPLPWAPDEDKATRLMRHLGHALWNIEKVAHFIATRPDLIDVNAVLSILKAGISNNAQLP